MQASRRVSACLSQLARFSASRPRSRCIPTYRMACEAVNARRIKMSKCQRSSNYDSHRVSFEVL